MPDAGFAVRESTTGHPGVGSPVETGYPASMDLRPFIYLAAAALIVGALFYFSFRQERRRRESLRNAARRMGLSYEEKVSGVPEVPLESLRLFGSGRARQASSVLRGHAEGFDLVAFDWKYTTGSGSSSSQHRVTVCAFPLPGRGLPAFELRPENVFHRIGSALGMQDIDFDAHPEFSRKNLLRGSDEAAVRELFRGPILRHFERHAGWCVEADGDWLVVYRSGKRPKPAELRRFFHDAAGIARLFSEA
jgi:hypothetical protein